MKLFQLKDMVKGWFVGDFKPTVLNSKDFEVAVKKYNAGDYEEKHYHKVATEITVIVGGPVEMNGVIYNDGQIVVIEPGDATDFKALDTTTTVVVKVPSAKDDKFMGEPPQQLSLPFPTVTVIESEMFGDDELLFLDSEEDVFNYYSDSRFVIKSLLNKISILEKKIKELRWSYC